MDTILIPLFIGALLLIGVFLPALFLYAIPIRCKISHMQDEERSENVILVSWGFVGILISLPGGISTTRILIGGHGIYSVTGTSEKAREREAPVSGAGISRGDIIHYLLPLVVPFGRFAIAVFRQIKIEEICGNIRIGLGDPVATGMLYGGYWASRFAMNASRIFVEMEPVFEGRVVACDLTVQLKLRHPLVILIEAITLVKNPAVWKLISAFRPARPVGVAP